MSTMARIHSDDISGFDLNKVGAEYQNDPYPYFKALRDRSPLHRNADGTYVVTRWQDVHDILTSSQTSVDKSEDYRRTIGEGPILEAHLHMMTLWDPPRHTAIRKSLAHAFTPRAMIQWEPMIETAVAQLLEECAAKGTCDFVNDFAAALPLTLICSMLGVETREKDRFRNWADSIVGVLVPGGPPAELKALADTRAEEWKTFFRDLIAERRKKPGDDLISMLIKAEHEGEKFSELAVLHNLALLLSAGHETTTALISNAVDLMLQFPEQRRRLENDPSLYDTAVEEVLRYDAPVQLGARLAKTDLKVTGGQVPAGSLVWTIQGAANRDERQFPNPDVFDVGRTPNRQLAFATGIHVCLGAPLARLEGKVALRQIIQNYPKFRRMGEPVRYLRTRYRSFSSYPLSLT